uniref:Uncharacterized protein n=1 Tax=Rhizophora mucronata TaxID=61149 RepID=A0A2P2QRB8_RHIMU
MVIWVIGFKITPLRER